MHKEDDFFFKNNPLPMIDISSEGLIRQTNKAFQAVYNQEQPSTIADIFSCIDPEDLVASMTNHHSFEGLFLKNSHVERTVSLSIASLGKNLNSFRVTILMETNEKVDDDLTTIINQLSLIYLLLDYDGKICYIDNDARKIIKDPDNVYMHYSLQLPHNISNAIEELIATGSKEAKLVSQQFEEGSTSFLITLIDSNLRYHVIIEDVTKIMENIRQNQYLQDKIIETEQLRMIGQLAGGIAHDFNNLLTIIATNLEVIKIEKANNSSIFNSLLEDVEIATDRASNLVKRLLNYAKQSKFVLEQLDIGEILQDMIKLFERVLPDQIKLNVDLLQGKHLVRIDTSGLENALLNLVLNARDAIISEGSITVKSSITTDKKDTRTQNDQIFNDNSYYTIEIQDDGRGMDRNQLNRLFDAFFTTKEYGIGLGLVSVKNTIERHNGIIEVESTLGEGSTFSVHLPIYEEQLGEQNDEFRREIKLDNKNIIIIDDERLILRTLQRLFVQHGASVITFDQPSDAVEYLANDTNVDLVLLDMVFPQTNGKMVMEQLMEIEPSLKFVLYSGYTKLDHSIGNDSNIVARVKKPFDFRDLLQIIGRSVN